MGLRPLYHHHYHCLFGEMGKGRPCPSLPPHPPLSDLKGRPQRGMGRSEREEAAGDPEEEHGSKLRRSPAALCMYMLELECVCIYQDGITNAILAQVAAALGKRAAADGLRPQAFALGVSP